MKTPFLFSPCLAEMCARVRERERGRERERERERERDRKKLHREFHWKTVKSGVS